MYAEAGAAGGMGNGGAVMGCYIGVATSDGIDVPGFKQDKYSGNRKFIDLLGHCQTLNGNHEMVRPLDIRAAMARLRVSGLQYIFYRMLIALDEHPDYWLNISY